jgi:hypothetical protein
MFPILIGMTIGMWNEGGKPNGAEVKDDACIEQFWFTKSAVTIRVADLPAASLNAASATTPCKVIPASKRALVVTPQAAVTTENPIPQAH